MSSPPRNIARPPFRWAVVLLAAVGMCRAADPLLPAIPLPPMPTVAQPDPKAKKPDAVQDKEAKEKAEKEKADRASPPWTAWQPPGRAVTLAECLAVAARRQPAVLAAQYSLAASERGYLALLHVNRAAEFFRPDLPIRRQQALRGIAAMTAEVRKAMQEGVWDTTRVYFEYVRATQQEQTANDIVDQLEVFYRVAEGLLEAGIPRAKLNRFTVYALGDAIAKVRELRAKAGYGRELAVAALAEAMGLEAGERVYPAATNLPVMSGAVTEEQVVGYALAVRPELVQAAVLVDLSRLEVAAQDAVRHRQCVPTYASGGDLHAKMLPAPVRNGDYRPGAVPPEMPATLVGKREDRVARAVELSLRMDEVYRKAENLTRLDAVKAYLEWKATAERMAAAEKRFERGKRLAEESRSAAAAREDPQLLVQNEGLAFEAQAAYVEAVYEHLKALMTLERVTAGQVKAGFADR